jgi:hypothetical protein
MRSQRTSLMFVCLLSVVCLTVAGCGPSYPYYSLKGSPESRVVVIHLDEEKTEEVPAGTGLGAGLTSEHQLILSTGEPVTIEKGAARVTMTAKGPAIVVKSVEYDGKPVLFHEPVF